MTWVEHDSETRDVFGQLTEFPDVNRHVDDRSIDLLAVHTPVRHLGRHVRTIPVQDDHVPRSKAANERVIYRKRPSASCKIIDEAIQAPDSLLQGDNEP